MRLKRIHASAGPNELGGEEREISDVRARVDEMVARLEEFLDQPSGVELIQPVRHRNVRIRRKVQLEAQATVDLAMQLLNGQKPPAPTTAADGTPFIPQTPTVVDAKNMKTVFDDGNAKISEVCTKAVADGSTDEGSERRSAKKQEQHELRFLHSHREALHHVKREVARYAGQVDVLG